MLKNNKYHIRENYRNTEEGRLTKSRGDKYVWKGSDKEVITYMATQCKLDFIR